MVSRGGIEIYALVFQQSLDPFFSMKKTVFFRCTKQEWSYLRGGLTTLDRDYGWINNIHHDIGTHVIHHLFPQIPHYHLIEAVSICIALNSITDKRKDCVIFFQRGSDGFVFFRNYRPRLLNPYSGGTTGSRRNLGLFHFTYWEAL